MIFQEVTEWGAGQLWNNFGRAIGFDKLREIYGPNWPRPLAAHERLFFLSEGDRLFGWVSIRKDPVEPFAWLALGVWPQYQQQGCMNKLASHAYREAFKDPGIDWVMFCVSRNNKSYLKNLIQKKVPVAGYINVPPPGYVFFKIQRREPNGRAKV